jgi:hypothetical protein
VTVLQILQLKSGAMAKGSGNTPLARDVSVASDDYINGAHHRLPWAVSRDLQAVAMSGKELYFRVTDPLLKDAAHGGMVKTGFDFEFSMFDGKAVPYVIKSYDGTAGTLMGVFRPFALAGSTAPTRGYLYFSNPAWTVSKEDHDQTFLNATSVLFLPSKIDQSGATLNFNRDLPTADKVIVNPGAQCDGDAAGTDFMTRNLTGNCGDFLISFLAQSIPNNSDNSPISFGGATGGSTVIFARHLFAGATQHTHSPPFTNAWRAGFTTSEGDSFYETASDVADTSLQHVVMRRVSGSHLELYVNGILVPWGFTDTPGGVPQSAKIDFTSQVLYIGRGAVANSRFWNGYLDCFKFFKDDAKTAAWALAEYNNLTDIDGGVVFGSPETLTTASVFGETIKIKVDPQLTSVDFKADKYASTLAGTIALRSPNPFDSSTIGTLTDRGANTVRYTNTLAQDPDNDCAVHLTNSVGNVIIPVRAHIVLTGPPPPSGYYKTPNTFNGDQTTKQVHTAANRSALQTLINSIPNTAWAATNCIKLTGDWGNANTNGSTFNINKGGTAADPLVIFMDNAGLDTTASWNGRPTVYNNSLLLSAPYIWLYGIQAQLMPKDVYDHWPTTDRSWFIVKVQAPNCFVTACHLLGSRHISNTSTDSYAHDFQGNYNWLEWKFQSTDPSEGGDTSISIVGRNTTAPKTSQRWITARNRWTDYPTQFTKPSDWPPDKDYRFGSNARCFNVGNGWGTDEAVTSDWEIYYNFIDGSASHIGEFKGGIKAFKWNHCPGRDQGMGRPGGGAYTRGGSPTGGEFWYNRLNCTQTMINGDNSSYVSYWMVNTSGNPAGEFRPTCRSTDGAGPQPKGLRGADGTTWVDCKATSFVLPYYFGGRAKYPPTSKLGAISPLLIAGFNSSCTFEVGNPSGSGDGAGTSLNFDGNGHPTGSNTSDLSNSNITKQTANPGSYTLQVPPILNSTVCGPGAIGRTWGQ